MSEKTFPVPLCSTVEGMQWLYRLYNTATDNFIRELRDANAELDALRAEVERLRALLREVAECGVESADERVRYVAVQIDADTWARVKAITAPAEEEGRDA